MTDSTFDPREAKGVSVPWFAVAICVVINMLDGFDVLAIAFTGPAVAREWALDPETLGLLFSAGLAGMTIGSLVLSPVADLWGRRTVLLTCLGVISIGMLASAASNDWWHLAIWRVVTGLGIGGLLSGANTATAEYTPAHRRGLAISFITAGYPIGAVLGGIVAIDLIQQFDWRAVFIFGGICSTVMIPIVWLKLPESLSYLLSKRPRNVLARYNDSLKLLKRPVVDTLPEAPPPKDGKKESLTDVFGPVLRLNTFYICAAYFTMMFTLYFVLNWTPKNLVDMGMSESVGISGVTMINVSGIVGGIALGFLVGLVGLQRIAGVFTFLCFVAMVVFGALPADIVLLMTAAAVLGFFLFGAFVSLYAIVAEVFPTHVRATGTGIAIGIGRIGATLGPIAGGFLIAAGWERVEYYTVLALPVLAGVFFATQAARLARRRTETQAA